MKFRRKATKEEVSKHEIKVADRIEWWWVTVTEDDMKHKIHVYWNKQTDGKPRGWQILSEKTCLGSYSRILTERNFECDDLTLKSHLQKIKKMVENLDYEKLIQSPWRFATYHKAGPYMIIDGVHRLIATFIDHYIYNSANNFLPIEHALCGICLTEMNTKFPEYFYNQEKS